MSTYCPWCGASLLPAGRFCSSCGREQQPLPAQRQREAPAIVSEAVTTAAPYVTVNVNTQPSAPVVVVGADGTIGPNGDSVQFHLHPWATVTIVLAALVVLATLFRDVLVVLFPVLVGGYAWWAYAGEPRGTYALDAMAASLPGARRLAPHQRRAVFVLIVGVVLWAALYLLGPRLDVSFYWPGRVPRPNYL